MTEETKTYPKCEACGGRGLNKKTAAILDSIKAARWAGESMDLTDEDKVIIERDGYQVLEIGGNVPFDPEWNGALQFKLDFAIMQLRAKQRGVYGWCSECGGASVTYPLHWSRARLIRQANEERTRGGYVNDLVWDDSDEEVAT